MRRQMHYADFAPQSQQGPRAVGQALAQGIPDFRGHDHPGPGAMASDRLTAFQHRSQRARIHHYVLNPAKILISDIRVTMKIEYPQTPSADLDIAPRLLENGLQRRPVVIES
jgi:hypothetical protein